MLLRLIVGAPLAVTLCVSGTAVAHADQGQIAEATARVADLEQQSALASQRAHEAYVEVQESKQRLEQLAGEVAAAQLAFEESKDTLGQIAREVYVSGGVDPKTLTLVLGDAEDFIRSLDDLASAGDAQNAAVRRAAEAATRLVAAQDAERAENVVLTETLDRLGQEKAAARQSLTEAQQYLAALQEEERRRIAEAIAAAREAERLRAEAAAREAAAREAERQRAEAAAREAAAQQAAAALAAQQQAAAIAAQQRAAAPPAPVATPPAPAPAPYANGGATDPGFAAAAAWASSPAAQAVIFCESSGNYSINTGNGYYGAWQFDYPSWHWNGGGRFAEYPHQATRAQQDFVAWTYFQRSGWRPWECAQKVL